MWSDESSFTIILDKWASACLENTKRAYRIKCLTPAVRVFSNSGHAGMVWVHLDRRITVNQHKCSERWPASNTETFYPDRSVLFQDDWMVWLDWKWCKLCFLAFTVTSSQLKILDRHVGQSSTSPTSKHQLREYV